MFSIMQGDDCGIPVDLKHSSGEPITPDEVLDVEITIGKYNKTYAKEELAYQPDDKVWIFPITQDESFKMISKINECQVRVKFANGVTGVKVGYIRIGESNSKEVL